MGFIPTVPGFIGAMELLGRIIGGDGVTFIFGPRDVFGKLPIDMGPFPCRFNDGDRDDDGNRGLNDGCPYDDGRNGPEFCDIETQNIR
jgi:hypothetical protein